MDTAEPANPPIFKPEYIQRVKDAYLGLVAEKQTPSIRLLRRRLGSGSNTWLAAVLRQHRAVWNDEALTAAGQADAPGSDLLRARQVMPEVIKQLESEVEARSRRKLDQLTAAVETYARENIDLAEENEKTSHTLHELVAKVESIAPLFDRLAPIAAGIEELQRRAQTFEQKLHEQAEDLGRIVGERSQALRDQVAALAVRQEATGAILVDLAGLVEQNNVRRIEQRLADGLGALADRIDHLPQVIALQRARDHKQLVRAIHAIKPSVQL